MTVPVTVVATRPAGEDEAFLRLLAERGVAAVAVPLLRVRALDDAADQLRDALAAHPSWWVACTSKHAAVPTARALEGSTCAGVAAVGRTTAVALERAGVVVDLVPDAATASSLGSALVARGVTGVVRLVSDRARTDLDEVLAAHGVGHLAIVGYVVEPVAIDAEARALLAGATVVTAASPSALEALAALDVPASVVAIGPTTADAARRLGFDLVAVASTPSVSALVDACLAVLGGQGDGGVDL